MISFNCSSEVITVIVRLEEELVIASEMRAAPAPFHRRNRALLGSIPHSLEVPNIRMFPEEYRRDTVLILAWFESSESG